MQLTVRDAARILNVPEKTIYRWISQGDLPVYRVQDQYRFNRAQLLEWATTHRVSSTLEITDAPTPGTALPTLLSALEAGGVVHDLPGEDKAQVLAAVVNALRLPSEVDRDDVLQVLLARERLGSTAIGDGLAIPHVRHPIVLRVPRPSLTICSLRQPVDFNAPDGRPVHTLFTLVSPTVRVHLHLLSRLSLGLHDPGFRDAVLNHATAAEILAQARRMEESFSQTPPPAPTT